MDQSGPEDNERSEGDWGKSTAKERWESLLDLNSLISNYTFIVMDGLEKLTSNEIIELRAVCAAHVPENATCAATKVILLWLIDNPENKSWCPGTLSKSPDGKCEYNEYDKCIYCGEKFIYPDGL